MSSYREFVDELYKLNSFDAKAFSADSEWNQEICNFMLSLALLYNDFRDLIMASELLAGQYPAGKFRETPEWGNTLGVRMHIARMMGALIHEAIKLIEKNRNEVGSQNFKKIYTRMHKKAKILGSGLGI